MRRIGPSLRTLADDIGTEGFLIIGGIAALAAWANGVHELNTLLVVALGMLVTGLALVRPEKKG